jgi:hypothetical protein
MELYTHMFRFISIVSRFSRTVQQAIRLVLLGQDNDGEKLRKTRIGLGLIQKYKLILSKLGIDFGQPDPALGGNGRKTSTMPFLSVVHSWTFILLLPESRIKDRNNVEHYISHRTYERHVWRGSGLKTLGHNELAKCASCSNLKQHLIHWRTSPGMMCTLMRISHKHIMWHFAQRKLCLDFILDKTPAETQMDSGDGYDQ